MAQTEVEASQAKPAGPARRWRGTASEPPEARLSWLRLGRLSWIVVALLVLVCTLVSLPLRYDQLARLSDRRIGNPIALAQALERLGLSPGAYAAYDVALDLMLVLAFAGLAGLIYWRKSASWLSLLVALSLVTYSMYSVPALDALRDSYPLWSGLRQVLQAVGLGSSLVVLYLFPSGQFVPGWTRALTAVWLLWTASWLLVPGLPYNPSNPDFPLSLGWHLFYLAWFLSGLLAQVYRYRAASSPVQRQQTKWVVFGLTVAVIGADSYSLLPTLLPNLPERGMANALYLLLGKPIFALSMLCIPLSIALSILRYRLWDIDLLINRALVYGLLTGLLAGTYAACIILLQATLSRLTGQQHDLAIALSTLVIAALFLPLRRSLQAGIDRHFYRRKYDAIQTIEAFAVELRDEVQLDALADGLVRVVAETMQPAHVSLWLRQRPAEG